MVMSNEMYDGSKRKELTSEEEGSLYKRITGRAMNS